jgi:hypothetical protein
LRRTQGRTGKAYSQECSRWILRVYSWGTPPGRTPELLFLAHLAPLSSGPGHPTGYPGLRRRHRCSTGRSGSSTRFSSLLVNFLIARKCHDARDHRPGGARAFLAIRSGCRRRHPRRPPRFPQRGRRVTQRSPRCPARAEILPTDPSLARAFLQTREDDFNEREGLR